MSHTLRPVTVRLLDEPVRAHVPATGALSSEQRAEVQIPASMLEDLWRRSNLERLADAYWGYLNRISLRLLRVVYGPASQTVVLLARPLALLRFHAPEYRTSEDRASVTWRIERGLLVARQGRDQGFLRIEVVRQPAISPERGRLELLAEVRNFYPWVRGSGSFARFGAWLYGHTQMRIHSYITKGFLRSLEREDF